MTAQAIGSNYYVEFGLVSPIGANKGLPVNADTTPNVLLVRNGTLDASAAVTVIAISTGRYSIGFIVPSTWDVLDNIDLIVEATISGTGYRAQLDAITIVNVLSSAYNPSSTVTRQMVEMIYGATNIKSWANADGGDDVDTDTVIANRIAWAINKADMYVEGKLSVGYKVPFDPMPALVAELIAERAGAELYVSPRGLVEGGDSATIIKYHIDRVDRQISDILSGTLRLLDTPTTFTQVPKAIRTPGVNSYYDFFGYGSPLVQVTGDIVAIPGGAVDVSCLPFVHEGLFYQT